MARNPRRLKRLILIKDGLVILMFVASIWLLVTSVKNEREAYRILKESSDYFEQSKLLDSLIELKMAGRDSVFFKPPDTIGELP